MGRWPLWLMRAAAAYPAAMALAPPNLQAAIAALHAQRAVLGDDVVDLAVSTLLSRGDAPLAQTLRQVSVLFLDIVGSTRLSQDLDPESLHAAIDTALARWTAVVQAHHGKVLQYAGDSLLAVFGAKVSSERDAESAVLCGLALLAEGAAFSRQMAQQHQVADTGVRVGVHTGGVLLGGGVDAEGSIRGLAVNIAARMEQAAPPGCLRVSHDTWQLVRGMFEGDEQPPIDVKGLPQPQASVLVRSAKPRVSRVAARGIDSLRTRMVGRDAELLALQAAFDHAVRGAQRATVTVVGDAGVGKSRLLDEFLAWAAGQPQALEVFRGRTHPHTQGQPYSLLRDLLSWRLGIGEHDSPASARALVEQALLPLFAPDDGAELATSHAHLLAHLVGLAPDDSPHVKALGGDARQLRNRAFHALAQTLRRLAGPPGPGQRLVLLALEDLHWADDASLDFLDLLGELNADTPLLVLAMARPSLFERRASWPRHAGGQTQRIELPALGVSHARVFARELLQRLDAVPQSLVDRLVDWAEGNPFYMEELVQMLIDQGAIEPGAGRWQLHQERLEATRMPPSLTAVLQARLDGLPARERRTLQDASVIGAVFWDQALHALDTQAADTLPLLAGRDLVRHHAGSGLEGLREYAFRHHLLHQVTYDSLLARQRRALHARLAAWLRERAGHAPGAQAGDTLGLTADHYDKAGDTANAVEFHARAAAHARERHVPQTALLHVQRALELLGRSQPAERAALPDDILWRLHETGEQAWGALGRRDEQRASLASMQAQAEEADDDTRRSIVALREAFLGMRLSDAPLQEAAARRAIALADKTGNRQHRARALRMLASALEDQGQIDQARQLAEAGLADVIAGGWPELEAQFYNALYSIASNQGELEAALKYNEADLAICKAKGDRVAQAVIHCNIGECWLEFGDLPQAQRWLDESLLRLRAVGERTVESSALSDLSQLALMQGDDVSALRHAQAAVQLAQATQAGAYIVKALLRLGDAEAALGRSAAALQAYAGAWAEGADKQIPDRFEAAAGLAHTALGMGDRAAALAHAAPLLAHWQAGGRFEGALRPRWVMAQWHGVLQATAHPQAQDVLAQAQQALMNVAGRLKDPALRQGFLQRLPEHRHLLQGTGYR